MLICLEVIKFLKKVCVSGQKVPQKNRLLMPKCEIGAVKPV